MKPILFLLLTLFIASCSSVSASNSRMTCKPVTTQLLWQKDTVCGTDKDGRQLFIAGFFTDAQGAHVACATVELACVMGD